MIRVNLLQNRREPVDGLEAAIAATGASAFVNRREIVVGALFLALGAGILYMNSVTAAGSEAQIPVVAPAGEEEARRPAARPAVAIEPSPGEAAGVESAARMQPALAVRPETAAPAPAEAARRKPAAEIAASAPPQESGAVRPLARPATRPAAAVVPPPSAAPALAVVPGELSALEVSGQGGVLRILATIGTQPAYQMFRLNSPNRVVVDLSGVTLTLPASQRQIAPSHPLVERIRVAQFQVSPPKVRMVLDVSEFPEVSVERGPWGLAFQVAAAAP